MSVKLTWYGHGTWGMEADGKQIILDPFFSGNPACNTSPDEVNPSTILITHAHTDHVGDAVSIAKRTGARIITVNELAVYLGTQGVEAHGGNHGGTVHFDGGSVKFTQAWHSSTYADGDGNPVAPGIPAGMIVRFGGQTMYFAGDTALFGDMALIGEEGLDLAVLPIGDNFTMGPEDAVKAAGLLRAKNVVPGHYNTFPLIEQDAEKFASDVEATTDSRAIVMQPGESVEIK